MESDKLFKMNIYGRNGKVVVNSGDELSSASPVKKNGEENTRIQEKKGSDDILVSVPHTTVLASLAYHKLLNVASSIVFHTTDLVVLYFYRCFCNYRQRN